MKKKMICAILIGSCILTGCGQSSQSDNTSVEAEPEETVTEEAEAETEETETSEEDEEATAASRDIFAMDTYMTVTAYGENGEAAVSAAEQEIYNLDEMLSTGSETSEVSLLNRDKQAEVSDVTLTLLEEAIALNAETEGAFNPAIYPIMKEWGFPTEEYKVPQQERLDELLQYMDLSTISIEENTITLQTEEMELDFGGIAKGYTSSRIMEIYKENSIESGLVSLGGNVQTLGYKPDGSLWRVAVQNPDSEEDYLGVLEVHDKAVITSGGYERYFEEDGTTYHHIIDPATGYPANSGIVSSTIVSSNGMLADGLSTSLFIMGLDKASDYWREHSDAFDAILLTEDGTLYVTEGIADAFTTSLEMQIIEK